MKMRQSLSVMLGATMLALAVAPACAQTYPTKPVTLMVPYPAGGLSDVLARKVNVALAAELKQPVIIENLGGAGGTLAAGKAARCFAAGSHAVAAAPPLGCCGMGTATAAGR